MVGAKMVQLIIVIDLDKHFFSLFSIPDLVYSRKCRFRSVHMFIAEIALAIATPTAGLNRKYPIRNLGLGLLILFLERLHFAAR
jgi:hypothetical protein